MAVTHFNDRKVSLDIAREPASEFARIASAVDEVAGGKLLIAAIPSGRTGITVHNNWHYMGQRQTDI